MREIKFRAWDDDKKEMIRDGDIGFINEEIEVVVGDNTVYLLDSEPYAHERKDLIPMQFTGLHDKHGVEIYEGDIALYKDAHEPAIVEWGNGCFWLVPKDGKAWENGSTYITRVPLGEFHDLITIPGNIYENP